MQMVTVNREIMLGTVSRPTTARTIPEKLAIAKVNLAKLAMSSDSMKPAIRFL